MFKPDTLAGKNALITGGGSGLGLTMARKYIELGARVTIVGRSEERLAKAAAELNAGLNGLSKRARFIHTSGRVAGSFDLAVINIELRPLLQVLGNLSAAARRVPKLYVTGFLASQLAEVTAAVKAAGFTARRRSSEADWRLLEASH